MLSEAAIKAKLADIQVPYLHKTFGEAQLIKSMHLEKNQIYIEIEVGFPARTLARQLQQLLSQALMDYTFTLDIKSNIQPYALGQQTLQGIPGVKNIIAIASGKGGVGKSTTCVNLALALAAEGAKVGILDADIYGPNQPHMLGATGHPEALENNKLKPLEAHGIQSMSIAYLLEQTDTPMIWRGPMVSSALQQLLHDTQWDNLDYLFVDLPPGTGDIQLTLSQKIPVTGAVIVTTPQDIALLDARKAVRMFEKVRVAVLGIVENMSVYTCPQCGHQEEIFGTGGAEKMAREYHIEPLGALPLDLSIRQNADGGCPTVAADPQSPISRIYRDAALRIAAKLALQGRDYMRKFPKIVIEDK